MTRTELKKYLINKKISLNPDNQFDSFNEIREHLKSIGIYCLGNWDWDGTHVFINKGNSVFRKNHLDDPIDQVYEEISYEDFILKFNELVLSRKEQIAEAASESYSEFVDRNEYFAFIDGATWADKNPIDKWHDVNDEPKSDQEQILCLDNSGKCFITVQFGFTFNNDGEDLNWRDFSEKRKIVKWIYINELLTKN